MCHACPLSCYTKPLKLEFRNPRIMIIAERPADLSPNTMQGKLLYDYLKSYGISNDFLYYTSILKCQDGQDMNRCSTFVEAEIRTLNPSLILCLGQNVGSLLMEGILANQYVPYSPVTTIVMAPSFEDVIKYAPQAYEAMQYHFQQLGQYSYQLYQAAM
jgi:uracil-DNA glycosylase family 4